jgi:uncharacterized membrane protein
MSRELTMSTLVLGILLWSLMHFLPAAAPGVRRNLIGRLGENPYKGLFALLMIVSIYLIYRGWTAILPAAVYQPPAWGRHLTALLMMAAFVLFFAPYPRNNFRRLLRHPQLTGVIVWGVAHLLANGENRSLALFGGFVLWAVLEMALINRRDGAWSRPDPAPMKNDILLVVVGLAAYIGMIFAHTWLFGVSPMG